MSTELVKAAGLAPFRKHVPERYRLYASKFLDFLEDRGYALSNPEGWNEYLAELRKKQKSGKMKGKKYSAPSLNKHISAMIDRIRYAMARSNLTDSERAGIEAEIKKIDRPTAKTPKARYFEPEEIQRLIDETDTELSLQIWFLWQTGARISEALGIPLADVKWDPEEQCFCADVIGKKSLERTLQWSPELHKRILAYYKPKNWLFETNRGNPYHRSLVSMRIKRASERILGRSGSAHLIRHSVGTEVQRQRGDIYFTAQVLGHKSIQTAATYYAHVAPTFQQKKAISDVVQGQRN